MSFTIPEAFVLQFGSNVAFLSQQTMARFRPYVRIETITGEAAYIEQLAPTAARRVTARHADSPIMNTQHLRRRIAPYDYDWGDLIDRQDKVRLLQDPASNYSQNAGFAMARADDDELIAAFFGTAYAGHTGSTALTWPNGNSESTPSQPAGTQVAVNDWTYGVGSGNAGLTISKIISGRVALMGAESGPDDEVCLGVRAKDIGNLLATTEFTSSDYAEVKGLNQTNFHGFRALGVTFVHSERTTVNGSGYYRLPMWKRSGIGLGIARDLQPRSAERPDKRFSQYVYCDKSIGAARLEEALIAEIIVTA